jgi:hypothetical protein
MELGNQEIHLLVLLAGAGVSVLLGDLLYWFYRKGKQ